VLARLARFVAQEDSGMAKDFTAMEDSSRSSNASIHDVSNSARRTLLRGGLGAAAAVVDAASLRPCTGHRLGLGPRVGPAVDGDVLQRHAAPRRLQGGRQPVAMRL